MKKIVLELVGKKASDVDLGFQINCFALVISYFNERLLDGKISAQHMLEWLQDHTSQVPFASENSIVVFWSSSDISLSPGVVEIARLNKNVPGFPFGLVMEHAAVFVSRDTVFQKASPADKDPFEILPYEQVRSEYFSRLPWVRTSFHRFNAL